MLLFWRGTDRCISRTWVQFPISKLEIIDIESGDAGARHRNPPKTRNPEFAAGSVKEPRGEPVCLAIRSIEGSEAVCGCGIDSYIGP